MRKGNDKYKKQYAQYLASDQWKELRAQARQRADNKCEFCGGPPDHVHHVRYPKRYAEDHVDNLVVACEPCHSKLHGIRNDVLIDDWIGTATAVRLVDGEVIVTMQFDPMPEEYRHITTVENLTKRVGPAQAATVLNRFGGEMLKQGQSHTFDLPITHELFYGHAEATAEELVARVLEESGKNLSRDDLRTAGEAFLDTFDVGPVWCPFKK
jgi:hypothetical protein